MEVIPKKNRYVMPWALLVQPSGLSPQDPCSPLFFLLIVGLLFK